jgi:putative transcriptional regulator
MLASRRTRALLAVASVITAWPALAVRAQGLQPTPARGVLLVSTPDLDDSRFGATVILLVHHDEEGSIGVMINRPTTIAPSAAFPESSALEDYEGTVYYGGPVAPARPLLLVRATDTSVEGGIRVLRDVYLGGSLELVASLPADMLRDMRLRIYAGHAEWGPGQLAAEIATGAWTLASAQSEQVFSTDPLSLWQRIRLPAAGEQTARAPRPPTELVLRSQPANDTLAGKFVKSALR